MPPPDDQRPRYQLGVTQVISWFLTPQFTPEVNEESVSASEGIAAHQRVQRAWPDAVKREVKLRAVDQNEACCLDVSGRVDGLETTPEGLRIIEIKTIRQPLESLASEKREAHWMQARFYAGLWMLQHPEGCRHIVLELVYVDIARGTVQSLRQTEEVIALVDWFDAQWTRLTDWFKALAQHREKRNHVLKALRFPMPDFRAGQRTFAKAIFRCVRDHGSLVIEAPTGSGKSLAALFPALKALGECRSDQIFYASTRNSGHTSALDTLRLLAPGALRVLQLQGIEKLCAQKASEGCQPETCPRRQMPRPLLDNAVNQVLDAYWMDSETLVNVAREQNCCPHLLQSRLIPCADVVIGDVNYVLNPQQRNEFAFQINRPFLLADEAHNLPERTRQMFSAELSADRFKTLSKALASANAALSKVARRLQRALLKPPDVSSESLIKLNSELQSFIALAEPHLLQAVDLLQPLPTELATLLRETLLQCRQWRVQCQDIENDFTCLPETREGAGWSLLCLSPARRLQSAYKALAGLSLFSASLSPPDYFIRLLGLPETTLRLRLPSPFPSHHQCTLLYTGVSLRLRDRQHAQHFSEIAGFIASLWQSRQGNYWIFTPSFDYLADLQTALERHQPTLPLAVQPRRSSLEDRQAFLNQFHPASPQGGTVGLVCLGSIFTESIDLPGEALIGVMVLGTGLPQPSPYQRALQRYFESEGLDAWRFGIQLPAWQKVVQAAGRVIRREDDRGVIVLVDQRFMQRDYASLFPPHWHPIECHNTEELNKRLRAFWSE